MPIRRIQFALQCGLCVALLLGMTISVPAAEDDAAEDRSPKSEDRRLRGDSGYEETIRPLLEKYCLDCHSTENKEGELDLERFMTVDLLRADVAPWQRVAEMLDNGEMPPDDAEQPSDDERRQLRSTRRT